MAGRRRKPSRGIPPEPSPTAVGESSISFGGRSINVIPTQSINETVNETVEITAEKSLNLMKIASLAAFSQFAMTRNIFPLDSFKQRVLHLDDSPCEYTEFKNSNPPSGLVPDDGSESIVFNILKREQSSHTNKFLDWLELGAYDALERGYLASIRLTLFDGSLEADKVVESFELHFSDNDEDITSTSGQCTHIRMSSAKEDAGYLLNSLKLAFQCFFFKPKTQPLHKLIVNVQLTYTEKALKDSPLYQPPGFTDLEDYRILHDGKSRIDMGRMSTGIQSMSAKWFPHNDDQRDVNARQPQQSSVASSPGGMALETPLCRRKRRSLMAHNQSSLDHQAPLCQPHDMKISLLSQDLSTSSTPVQYREDKAAIRARAKNLNTEPDTQSLSQYFQQFQDISGQRHSQELVGSEPTGNLSVRSEQVMNYVFSQKTIQTALKGNPPSHLTAIEETTRVTCDCHVQMRDAEMLQCQACLSLQHPACYGYVNSDEPDIHFCYNCLLQDNEPETMSKLGELAVRRRMLQYIMDCGYPQHKLQLQTYLGRSLSVVNKLSKELQSEGYLLQNPKHNPKSRAAKTSEYTFNDVAEQLQRLKQTYRDPTMCIAHLMELQTPDEREKGSFFGNLSSTQGTPSTITGAYGSSTYAFQEQGELTQSIFSATPFAPIDNISSTQGTPSTATSSHKPSSNFTSTAREMSTQSSLPVPTFTPIAARYKRKSPRNTNGHQKRLKKQ